MTDGPLARSRYRPVATADVLEEYRAAASAASDHAKAKWGSDAGMRNRFRLAVAAVEWSSVKRWLDVGCATGGVFVEAGPARASRRVGVDLTAEALVDAASRALPGRPAFARADVATLPFRDASFDLVTLLGVLQQCGATPEDALREAARVLVPGGQVFLTTKSLAWTEFTAGRLEPEPSHSWFHPSDITDALDAAGFDVCSSGGLLASEGRTGTFAEGHSMYFLGRRR